MYVGLCFSIAELSPALPHTGGAYSFGRTAFGPWGGFLTGLAESIEYVLTPAVIVVGIGGYIGTMEAVSQGAAEAGGHVVGVTCDEIEAWRPVKPNRWVQDEWRFPTVRERLFALIENCEAAFALPGGVGTLAEISVMWNQMQTAAIATRPLILIGEGWQRIFERLFNDLEEYLPPHHRELLSFAPDEEQAYMLLQTSFDNP